MQERSRVIETALSGYELLNDPLLNKGTAFNDAERDEFELHGLLPRYVTSLDLQVGRRHDALQQPSGDLLKYIFLRGVQDNNETLFYALLARHIAELIRGADYDALVAAFVEAVRARWPHVLLHWEDFALRNANRLLTRYRDRLCSFNDDIQGTAAIAVGAILSAVNVTGLPLAQQRIAVLGAGSAGTGICALLLRAMVDTGLAESEARKRFYLVDRHGLLLEGMSGLQPFQSAFARPRDDIATWPVKSAAHISRGSRRQ